MLDVNYEKKTLFAEIKRKASQKNSYLIRQKEKHEMIIFFFPEVSKVKLFNPETSKSFFPLRLKREKQKVFQAGEKESKRERECVCLCAHLKTCTHMHAHARAHMRVWVC